MNSIVPIFILGNNRCGTTFLGNLLTQNFEIATVEHPLHFGILESNIYSYRKYFGDFANLNNYIRAVELFGQSDFQMIAGLPPDYFFKKRVPSFYHMFLELMDEHAKASFKQHWVTKIDPNLFVDEEELKIFLDLVKQRYANSKFIMIERNYLDYINSLMNMKGRAKNRVDGSILKRNAFIGHRAAFYFHNNRKMETLYQKENGLKVLFEEIIKDKETGVKAIEEYLNLKPKHNISEALNFKRNTSFHVKKKEKKSFAKTANLWKTVFQLIPGLDGFTVRLANKQYLKPPISSPLWWRMKKTKYFKEELNKELVQMNQTQLLDIVDDQSITA